MAAQSPQGEHWSNPWRVMDEPPYTELKCWSFTSRERIEGTSIKITLLEITPKFLILTCGPDDPPYNVAMNKFILIGEYKSSVECQYK